MKINLICFSPCDSTKDVASYVAKELASKYNCEIVYDDFTLPADRKSIRQIGPDDLLIIASPTYAGKLPNKIMPDFKEKIKGSGKAIAITTFGNRSYDNSLAELVTILKKNGFKVCAAAAIVNEHSFAHIGKTRDYSELKEFVSKIDLEKEVQVPGDADAPYYVPKQENGEPAKFLKAVPKTDLEKCNGCGLCAASCPMGSINKDNISEITGVCIKCHACINKCPNKAKYFDDEQLLSHIKMLQKNYSELKNNEFFV